MCRRPLRRCATSSRCRRCARDGIARLPIAANPFGVHDFLGQPDADGSLTLKTGESFSLYYRVILHAGDDKAAHVAEAFERYAREPVAK